MTKSFYTTLGEKKRQWERKGYGLVFIQKMTLTVVRGIGGGRHVKAGISAEGILPLVGYTGQDSTADPVINTTNNGLLLAVSVTPSNKGLFFTHTAFLLWVVEVTVYIDTIPGLGSRLMKHAFSDRLSMTVSKGRKTG